MPRDSPAASVLRIFADTRTERHGSDQSKHTTHAVHDGRACEVVERVAEHRHHPGTFTAVAQPAAAPGPVTLHRIDNQRDERTINQIHREFRPLRHRTAHDRGTRGTEHRLENKESLHGQAAFIETEITPVWRTDKSRAVASEHESESDEKEQERTEHEINKVLHQYIRRVFTSCESCLTQGEPWLHPENQHGSQQHPYSI